MISSKYLKYNVGDTVKYKDEVYTILDRDWHPTNGGYYLGFNAVNEPIKEHELTLIQSRKLSDANNKS